MRFLFRSCPLSGIRGLSVWGQRRCSSQKWCLRRWRQSATDNAWGSIALFPCRPRLREAVCEPKQREESVDFGNLLAGLRNGELCTPYISLQGSVEFGHSLGQALPVAVSLHQPHQALSHQVQTTGER